VKTERWGAGMVICLERSADLYMAQLMPLPLTVCCFSKIQTGFAFLVPAHPGSLCAVLCTDSVQKSLEQKFARRGGSIPVTPSPHFEKRIAVSSTVVVD